MGLIDDKAEDVVKNVMEDQGIEPGELKERADEAVELAREIQPIVERLEDNAGDFGSDIEEFKEISKEMNNNVNELQNTMEEFNEHTEDLKETFSDLGDTMEGLSSMAQNVEENSEEDK